MTNFEIYTYMNARKGGENLPVTNPALRLFDWEGTVLKEYTAEQVEKLTALPEPSSLNADVDRDLLSFQGYNWSISDIKAWVTAHEGECLPVGAIYTTTDGQDHIYRNNPRINTDGSVSMLKRAGTIISYSAFKDHYSLEKINIPNITPDIYPNAFSNCYSITHINIPASVLHIENNAFEYCRALKSVNLPNSIIHIGEKAFMSCYPLENVNIPDSVSQIWASAFANCYSLKNINIPSGVSTINSSAFLYCCSLTKVKIPNSVEVIGEKAFNGCFKLKEVSLPNCALTIGTSAFANCPSLTSVCLPSAYTESIGASAFSGCSCLTDIVIKGEPTLTNVNAFNNIYSDYLIYVPRTKLSWYSTATNWTTLYNNNKIVAIEDNAEYLESIGIDV